MSVRWCHFSDSTEEVRGPMFPQSRHNGLLKGTERVDHFLQSSRLQRRHASQSNVQNDARRVIVFDVTFAFPISGRHVGHVFLSFRAHGQKDSVLRKCPIRLRVWPLPLTLCVESPQRNTRSKKNTKNKSPVITRHTRVPSFAFD